MIPHALFPAQPSIPEVTVRMILVMMDAEGTYNIVFQIKFF